MPAHAFMPIAVQSLSLPVHVKHTDVLKRVSVSLSHQGLAETSGLF